MIKKFLLILSLLLLITGCHGKIDNTSDLSIEVPENFDESKQYNLTFWAKSENNKVQVEVYNNAIKEFEKLYPNIHITMKMYTDYSRIYNDVITNISTDTTPNICITFPDHIATYITGNDTVVSLDSFISNEKYGLGGSELKFESVKKDEIIPRFLNECYLDNKLYAMPYIRSSEALYINEDYVKALGYEVPDIVTWDFMWEVSNKAMEKNDDGTFKLNNQNVLIPIVYKSTDNMMIQSLYQLDAGYTNLDKDILIFNDTTRNLLKKLGEEAYKQTFGTFKMVSYPANLLNAGQCIFAIDSTAGSTWMGANAPLSDIPDETKVNFNTVIRLAPQCNLENIKIISQGPSLCIFNKKDKSEVLASWLFMQYLLSNDVQINYSKTEGYIPVTYKAINSDTYKEYLSNKGLDNLEYYDIKIDVTKMFIDNIEYGFTTPPFNGSTSLRNAAGELIEQVCKDVKKKKIINDEYIDNLFENMNTLYRLDQTSEFQKKDDLGPLPKESKYLLTALGSIWLGIIIYQITNKNK